MSTKTDLEPAKKVTLLKHLASGKSADVVATIVGLPRDQVVDVASHHGYPDKDKLAWAADILQKKIDDGAAELPDRTSEARREERAVSIATRPAAAPAIKVTAGGIEDLIATGKGHESKRIQRAADKLLDDVDRLRTLVA